MVKFNPAAPLPFFYQCAKELESEQEEIHSEVKESIKTVLADHKTKKAVISALTEMAESHKISHQVLGRWSLKRMKLLEDSSSLFPYTIEDKAGIVSSKRYTSRANPENFPETEGSTEFQGYVVNMPIVINGLDVEKTNQKISKVLDTLRDQGFGASNKESQARSLNELCVVLGGNRCKSIDKARNRAFKDYIEDFSTCGDMNAVLFGFMWEPRWMKGKQSAGIKDVRNYYTLLKRLDATCAEKFRKKLEQPEKGINARVPYQEIRSAVKNNKSTKLCVKYLRKINPDRKIYLSIMDPDFIRLRTKGIGLFSHYNDLIYRHCQEYDTFPALASTGYKAASNEREIIQLGIELDQCVREALGTVLPLAPYLPEPNMIVLVEEGEDTVKESFINSTSKNYESRHLVRDVVAKRDLDPFESIVFQTQGAIPTTIPPRFYNAKNQSITITPKTIRNKTVLQALRGIGQSSIESLSWAKSVENAFSVRGQKIRAPLCQFFHLYDPIYLAYNQTSKYSVKASFDPMMAAYDVHVEMMEEAIAFFKNTSDIRDDFFERNRTKRLITKATEQFSEVADLSEAAQENCIALYKSLLEGFVVAYKRARELGLTETEIFLAVEASRVSGQAIFKILDRVRES